MSCGHRIEPNEDVLDYWRRIGNMPCKRNPLMSDLITQHGSFRVSRWADRFERVSDVFDIGVLLFILGLIFVFAVFVLAIRPFRIGVLVGLILANSGIDRFLGFGDHRNEDAA